MRIAILGASAAGVATARLLIGHKHEVVIVEKDKAWIDELQNELDCGFIHGDGSRPGLLREVGPSETDVLLCLSGDDQVNIIASLVGRSLGFGSVVTKISDPEYEHICAELGLDNTISAAQVTARRLLDTVEGRAVVDLSTVLRGDVRFFVISVAEDEEGPADGLALPDDTWILYGYRGGKLLPPAQKMTLEAGDDLVLLTASKHLKELKERGKRPEAPASAEKDA
jgi:trk system potassium uptake protein TrkA